MDTGGQVGPSECLPTPNSTHDRPHRTLSQLVLPLSTREQGTVNRWFDDETNVSIMYRDSAGHTATILRGNIEPLRDATAYLGGDIMEMFMSRLWPGAPSDRVPGVAPYATDFHKALFSLARDDSLPLRSRWAQLYTRIVPILSRAVGAEAAEGHTGVCIPVHTTGHWVLVVLHLQTATFTVYNSISSPGHQQVEAAIDEVKFRLGQMATVQGGHINWGATSWTAPTHLAQQYDVATPDCAGGDCLLFVCCWTLSILSGDPPSLTTVRQVHMRNIRNQLLLSAVEGDETHNRRRLLDPCATNDAGGLPRRTDMEQDSEGPPLTKKRAHPPCDHTQQVRRPQQERTTRRAECQVLQAHTLTLHQQDGAAQLTLQRLGPGPGGDPGSGGTAVAMQIDAVTPALNRKRDTASALLKTHRRHKQALTSQQQGEADTSAPGGQQGTNYYTGGEQVRQPPQTAYNKSNSKAEQKNGHDPYG
jgi:hypothetical protein